MTLDWQPLRLVKGVVDRKFDFKDVLRYLLFASGLLLIYVCDFRLRSTGRDMSLAFLGLKGLAQVVSAVTVESKRPYLSLAVDRQDPWPTTWEPYATIPIVLYAIQSEFLRPNVSSALLSNAAFLIINFCATVVTFTASPFAANSGAQTCSAPRFTPTTSPVNQKAIMLAFTGIVTVQKSLMSAQPVVLSIWQFGGYLIALFAFITSNDFEDFFQSAVWNVPNAFGLGDSSSTWLTSEAFGILALVLLCWPYTLYHSFSMRPPAPDRSNLNLDIAFRPHMKLDIVISRHSEPVFDLVRDIESLLGNTAFQGIESRVLIYNKNNDTLQLQNDIASIDNGKTDVSVVTLSNVGREGEAYLHHITANWDTLATHTLFMQAKMEDFALVQVRIENFFVPETGFLPLSYEGVICENCENCHDVSWSDDPALLSSMYSLSNAGRKCQNIVLTYRGQFMVSGARLRGNEKSTYENLLRQLRDPDSHIHSPTYTQSRWHEGQVDSLDAPVFGFTLERMWGVIMQCSELRVGYWSPSLLAAFVRPTWLAGGFAKDVVQCLDRPQETEGR